MGSLALDGKKTDSMPERLTGLRELAPRFDGLFVDLWGVIHDGTSLFPHVLDALERLRQRGTSVVFVSNSSRSGGLLEAHLASLGVERSLYVRVISSGDVTKGALTARDPALFSLLPRRPRCLHLGDADFVAWLHELEPIVELVPDGADSAVDLVLVTGSFPDEVSVDQALTRLAGLASRRVPLVCTNPDRVVHTAGGRAYPPGALAQGYRRLGAPTFMYGKPHPPIFAAARGALPGAERIAVVGDLLETDIRGGRDSGLFGVLVTATGVNAEALGASPPDEAVAALGTAAGVCPDALLPRFAW